MGTNWQLVGALQGGGSDYVQVGPLSDGGSLPNYVLEAGGLLRQTKAYLDSDLAHADGTLAFVYGDHANNGNYVKSGSSGQGSWVKIDDFTGGGTGDDEDRFVSADYVVEPNVGYVEADCTSGDVTITFTAADGLLAKKCWFRKSSPAHALLINDGNGVIHTENSTNAIGYRRAGGNLIRL